MDTFSLLQKELFLKRTCEGVFPSTSFKLMVFAENFCTYFSFFIRLNYINIAYYLLVLT